MKPSKIAACAILSSPLTGIVIALVWYNGVVGTAIMLAKIVAVLFVALLVAALWCWALEMDS